MGYTSGGIGAAIAWLVNRKAASAKAAKAVHDTYKTMYEDISALLVENQKKNEKQSIHYRKSLTRHAPKARASSGRSTAFHALSRLFSIALTAVLALSAMSCRSKQTLVQSEVQSDSLRQESSFLQSSSLQMLTTTEAQKIAADTAMLTLPMQSLLNLPDSAVFRRQSGRLIIEALPQRGQTYISGAQPCHR